MAGNSSGCLSVERLFEHGKKTYMYLFGHYREPVSFGASNDQRCESEEMA